MRPSTALSLALAAPVLAFKNTSPFFLFSTSSLPNLSNLPSLNLASSLTINSHLVHTLSACPSDAYILVSQPGVNAHDYGSRSAAPHLRNALNSSSAAVGTVIVVPEVHGEVDLESVRSLLEQRCQARVVSADAATGEIPNVDAIPRIVKVDFGLLPVDHRERMHKMSEHDSFLHAVVSTIGSRKYTVLFATTPSSNPEDITTPQYEMDHRHEALPHSELKRSVDVDEADGARSNAPLFEKYVFLSPAIFMGGLVALILFLIGYVGFSALSSLQVSYFAFSKEMGPAAQKKQQ